MANFSTEQLTNMFLDKYEEGKKEFMSKRPNILVCGYTGSGKTSLIRTVLGDIVPENCIGNGSPKTMQFDEYENENIVLWDSKGLEAGEAEENFTQKMKTFIRTQQEDRNVDNHVHLIWYVIQGSGARVTECDFNLMKNIFNRENVITVISKRDLMRPAQLESMLDILTKGGISESRIIATSDTEGGSIGCRELVDLSVELLPKAYQAAFINAQQVDLERKIEAIRAKVPLAKKIIAAATGVAAGIGLVPIPLSDATLLLPTQMTMIGSLAALYQMENAMIANFSLPFLTQCAGIVTASSLTKLIPGVGNLINAGVASSLTATMGWFVQQNFENICIRKIKNEPVPEFGLNFESFKIFYQENKNKFSSLF